MQKFKSRCNQPFHFLIIPIVLITVFFGFGPVTEVINQSKQLVEIELNYFQINGESHITISLSEESGNHSAGGTKIQIYLNHISDSGKMGTITTEPNGSGKLILQENFMAAADSLNVYRFIAILDDDERFESTEEEMIIQAVDLSVETYTEDDKKFIRATLLEKMDTGELIPVEWEEVLIEAERLFGLLPIEEFTFTDEFGEVTVAFPDDLPGNSAGDIVIVARLYDHPDYGHVEVHKKVNRGVSLASVSGKYQTGYVPSINPPVYFAILFWAGIITVWGIIGYMLFNVFKIAKSTTNIKTTDV